MTAAATHELAPVAAPSIQGARPTRPYPGLRPFVPEEWSIFCGRERTTRDVIGLLADHNVVLVHGGSGCGKSSLIAAGVLPSLERDLALADQHFAHATIRPSQGPLGALAQLLADHLGPMPQDPNADQVPEAEAAEQPRHPLSEWTSALLFAPDIVDRIEYAIVTKGIDLFCLVFDQFEEIFAWARDRRASDVEAMARLLALLAQSGAGERLVIIVTMRSDFLGQCAEFPLLAGVINTCQYFVPNLDDRALELAIREPATMFGGKVDDALVMRLKTESTGNLDALPVLQHALMRMAEPKIAAAPPEWTLTLEDYDRVTAPRGDDTPPEFVGNALSAHAEEIRAALCAVSAPEMAGAIEAVFRALFDIDAAGRIVRRPTPLTTLEALAGPARGKVRRLVESYAADGTDLLRYDRASGMIDITHEALLRNWWRMSTGHKGRGAGWIQLESDDALNWRTLAKIAYAGGERLDKSLLAQFREPFARFAKAPERVRRYLLRGEKCDAVTDEPEWTAVAGLMARSESRERWRQRAIWAAVVVPVLLGVVWAYCSQLRSDAAASDAAAAESQSQNAFNQRVVAQANSLLAAKDEASPDVKLSSTEAELIQLVDQTTGAGSATGFIWIGGESVPNLRPRSGNSRIGSIANIVNGSTYLLTVNLALRETEPDSANRSKRIGALIAGSQVVAIGPARRAANGEYWLKVKPVPPAGTVYVQYDQGDPTRVRQQLQAINFKVPSAERLTMADGTNEVRYCYQGDEQLAATVATAIAQRNGATPPIRWIGRNGTCQKAVAPGTVEVWIDRAE